MKPNPKRAEYEIGRDAYDRQVTLKFERTYDGKDVWTIHRAEADQRDEAEQVSGLTAANLRAIGDAVRSA